MEKIIRGCACLRVLNVCVAGAMLDWGASFVLAPFFLSKSAVDFAPQKCVSTKGFVWQGQGWLSLRVRVVRHFR